MAKFPVCLLFEPAKDSSCKHPLTIGGVLFVPSTCDIFCFSRILLLFHAQFLRFQRYNLRAIYLNRERPPRSVRIGKRGVSPTRLDKRTVLEQCWCWRWWSEGRGTWWFYGKVCYWQIDALQIYYRIAIRTETPAGDSVLHDMMRGKVFLGFN